MRERAIRAAARSSPQNPLGRPPVERAVEGAHSHSMPIECPNPLCTVTVAIDIDGEVVFGGGQCIELLGTKHVHQFERCPVLAKAVSREIKFPDSEG